MSNDFNCRLLYTQKSSAVINEQEPVTVSSTIYAIKFMYPGATQHTTSRVRITCTYRDTDQFEAHAGVIERWSDKGWIIMDDYTDDVLAFHTEKDFRKRLLDYAHSFIMGMPLEAIDKGYIPDNITSTTPRKSTAKKLFDYKGKEHKKSKKTKEELKDNYNPAPSKKDDDDDDLDWI
jgi:hypothetical protein